MALEFARSQTIGLSGVEPDAGTLSEIIIIIESYTEYNDKKYKYKNTTKMNKTRSNTQTNTPKPSNIVELKTALPNCTT